MGPTEVTWIATAVALSGTPAKGRSATVTVRTFASPAPTGVSGPSAGLPADTWPGRVSKIRDGVSGVVRVTDGDRQ